MKPHIITLICATVILLSSCNIKEKYAKNSQSAVAWLAENKGTPGTTISGSWAPGDPGWGIARLEQHAGTVTGSIGSYEVDGTVHGTTAYLLMKDNGWIYYTAILQRSGKNFVGFYSEAVPFESDSQSPMLLTPLTR
jgi:hypothetical protein